MGRVHESATSERAEDGVAHPLFDEGVELRSHALARLGTAERRAVTQVERRRAQLEEREDLGRSRGKGRGMGKG